MKVDSRGRVRFTYLGIRYEFTNKNLNLYSRTRDSWGEIHERLVCGDIERADYIGGDMLDPVFREKLRQALNLIHQYSEHPEIKNEAGFTTNIFIPKHMRAV